MDDWRSRARAVMRDKGVTQDGLSELLDMTQGGLQHWLAGSRQPKLSDIDRIAVALGVPGPYLTHGVTADDVCTDLAEPGRSVIRRLIAKERSGQAPATLWATLDQVLTLAEGTLPQNQSSPARPAPEHQAEVDSMVREAEERREREQREQQGGGQQRRRVSRV